MELINFENFPNTTKPLSAEILNHNFDLMHPVGSIHITSTNENPSSKFGGTWELIDKEFKELKGKDKNAGTYFVGNSENTTSCELFFVRNKKSIDVRLNVYNAVDLADSDVEFGTIKFEALGLTALYYGIISGSGGTDGGNGFFQYSVNWETGKVISNDVVTKVAGDPIPSGSSCYMQFELPALSEYMLDSACDKFYWKRTA